MRENKIGTLLIGIVSLLCLLQAGGRFTLWTLIVGVILLVMLFVFNKESYETRGERIVFCLIGGVCGLLATGLITPVLSTLLGTISLVLYRIVIELGSPIWWQMLFGVIAYGICWRVTRNSEQSRVARTQIMGSERAQ